MSSDANTIAVAACHSSGLASGSKTARDPPLTDEWARRGARWPWFQGLRMSRGILVHGFGILSESPMK